MSKVKEIEYTVRFETPLNQSLKLDVIASNWENACKKVKKTFPKAFNFN